MIVHVDIPPLQKPVAFSWCEIKSFFNCLFYHIVYWPRCVCVIMSSSNMYIIISAVCVQRKRWSSQTFSDKSYKSFTESRSAALFLLFLGVLFGRRDFRFTTAVALFDLKGNNLVQMYTLIINHVYFNNEQCTLIMSNVYFNNKQYIL